MAVLLTLLSVALVVLVNEADAFNCAKIKCSSLNTAITTTGKPVVFTNVLNFRACFYRVALSANSPKLWYFQYVRSRKICYGFASCYYGYSSNSVLAGNIKFCPKPRVPPPPPPPPEPKYYCSNPVQGEKRCRKRMCPGSTKCRKRSSGPACCCTKKKPNPKIENGLLVDCTA